MRKTWGFHVAVWQRTATKCTKIYNVNARAQLLGSSRRRYRSGLLKFPIVGGVRGRREGGKV